MDNKPSPIEPKHSRNPIRKQCCISGKAAISLMEISIVIVVLGLLTSAIIGGASIRKMAGQRHLISSINAMTQSLLLFKQTYGYWPGDFPNANEVFGPLSEINKQCPPVNNDGNAASYTKGVSGNGDGTVNTLTNNPQTFDWGTEAMFVGCHMFLSGLTPSGMRGIGMRTNENVNVHIPTSPTHSTFGGRSMLHLPTYNKSFLTYGAVNAGLPTVQINSSRNIFKDIVPFIMQAKNNRALDVHTLDARVARISKRDNHMTELPYTDMAGYSEDGTHSVNCSTSHMTYHDIDPLKKCNNTALSADSDIIDCGDPYGVTASECHMLTGSGFTTYANRCVCTFQGWTFVMTEKIHFSLNHMYIPVSE